MTSIDEPTDSSSGWLDDLPDFSGQCYLVGGAIRDELLGKPVGDRDWVVLGVSKASMENFGFKTVGREFSVFLHPETGEEYALARREKKTGPGHRGFKVEVGEDITLEQDLKRRDLTINAMAKGKDGVIIDPFHGREHLKEKVLHHVSLAFVEDPLRLLRVARFYARYYDMGFRVAAPTFSLLKKMVSDGDIDSLMPQRVWKECVLAMETTHPSCFFSLLGEVGAMSVVFPELQSVFESQNSVVIRDEGHFNVFRLMDYFAKQGEAPEFIFSSLWLSQELSDEKLRQIKQRLGLPKVYSKRARDFLISRDLLASKWSSKDIMLTLDALGLWGHRARQVDWFYLMEKVCLSGMTGRTEKKIKGLQKFLKEVVLPFNSKEYLQQKPPKQAVGDYLEEKRFDVVQAYLEKHPF